MVTLQALNLQVCQKIDSITSMFQLICLPFKNTCFKENLKEKSNNFEMQCIVCYSRCIALHLQLLQLSRLTDRWSLFYETRVNHLMGQHLPSATINKKERERENIVQKYTVEGIVHRIWKNTKITNLIL